MTFARRLSSRLSRRLNGFAVPAGMLAASTATAAATAFFMRRRSRSSSADVHRITVRDVMVDEVS